MTEPTPQSPKAPLQVAPVWDMSQERAFIENLLGQRLYFFLVFATIVIAAITQLKEPILISIILTISAWITWLFTATIYRASDKLDKIFEHLKNSEPDHPYKIIDEAANNEGKTKSQRRHMGETIPRICRWGFILAMAASWLYAAYIYYPLSCRVVTS
ncbi:MAG: hypothetical protein AB7F96_10920 [Beijerinckiaceae bacterium]